MKKEDKSQNESLGYKNFLPYFRLLGTDWLPFVAALFFWFSLRCFKWFRSALHDRPSVPKDLP